MQVLLAVALAFGSATPAVASTSSVSVSSSTAESGMLSTSGSITNVDSTETVWADGIEYVEPEPGWDSASDLPEVDTRDFFGSLQAVREQVGMTGVLSTGRGVDIALIDTGVVPVDGLDTRRRVVNGPDLSFESQSPDLRYLDTFGHGTHVAGIMVSDSRDVPGIAPGARLVNVKVASYNGAVDVTQILAAIDWVIQNRNAHGLNIRVLNLSYGTDSFNRANEDLIAYAVEQAWRAGIVVVVAGGNDGNDRRLTSPAYNPYVIAVGAADGSLLHTDLNPIPGFSNCGTSRRPVDLVAPGRSIMSLRNPGSHADVNHPGSRSDDGRRFVGSGSSQAAAVVSGAVAVLLESRPNLTPNQVKNVLMRSATALPAAPADCDGAGLLNVGLAVTTSPRRAGHWHAPTKARGTLDASRGSHRVMLDGIELAGETDIFGNPFDAAAWARRSAAASAWTGGSWNGTQVTGTGFAAPSWAGPAWSGVSWSGVSWSGVSWSGVSWSGVSWSGGSWSGGTWSGASWSGASWSEGVWN